MQSLGRCFLITVVALGLGGTDASAQTRPEATSPARRQLLRDSVAHARARWVAARPERYRVSVDFRCECARGLDNAPWVLVHGDSILLDSVRADQRQMVVNRPVYYTVDGLFTTLEAALRDTLVSVEDLRFDAALGVPLSFTTGRRCVASPCSTGGWTDVKVRGFELAPVRVPERRSFAKDK